MGSDMEDRASSETQSLCLCLYVYMSDLGGGRGVSV